jgi:uncharacterized coiled-coil DUF342 family protein
MGKTIKVNGAGNADRAVKLEVLCELTAKEHEEKSDRLAQLDLKINATAEAAKAKAARYRESIKLLKEERDPLAEVVSTHREKRIVECVEEANFDRNVIVTKRRDTGDRISERPMEAEERERMAQGRLPRDLPELPEEQTNDIEVPRPAA